MSHVLLNAQELLGALEEQLPCADCTAGLGVHIEAGDWYVVVLHSVPCPGTAKPRTLRLADTDSHTRCRRCGGLLGEVEAVTACPRCEPRPSTCEGGIL